MSSAREVNDVDYICFEFRQTEELMGDEDCAVLSDALVEFAILNWSKDYPMAVSALLSTGDFAKIRAQIPRFPDDSTMIETVLLCYAITSVFSSEAKDLKSVWSLSCKSLVEAALRNRRWRSFDGKTDVSTDVEQLISSLSGLWQKKTLTATSTGFLIIFYSFF